VSDHDQPDLSRPDSAGPDPARSRWRRIDHVQLAIPAGGEARARAFYVEVLGFREVPKPAVLAARGGCWFESGAVRVHVGVDPDFRPARKAHPALVVERLRELVRDRGLDIVWSDEIPGTVRGFVHDPFGNRIELVDAATGE
jgi:catechol 2,3-dioxygenase-like lactoylglutathione lyase family enzyme